MLTDVYEQGLGVRVLGSFDWGNPSDCGMLFPSFLDRELWLMVVLCQIIRFTRMLLMRHIGLNRCSMSRLSNWLFFMSFFSLVF